MAPAMISPTDIEPVIDSALSRVARELEQIGQALERLEELWSRSSHPRPWRNEPKSDHRRVRARGCVAIDASHADLDSDRDRRRRMAARGPSLMGAGAFTASGPAEPAAVAERPPVATLGELPGPITDASGRR